MSRAAKTFSFPYEVRGNLKLGNFRMEVTDLTIPLTGVSIDISRMYDTLDRDAYEFGHGWRLKLPGGWWIRRRRVMPLWRMIGCL
jgi:hypothetical protein